MKALMICACVGLLSCTVLESTAKFAVRKKAAVKEYYHAYYTFRHIEYEDVEVAVRIEIVGGKPSKLEVKDLTTPSTPLETLMLSASGNTFTGTSTGATGGKYSVSLNNNSACCGQITFVPTVDTDATFVGTKSGDLSGEEWADLTATNRGPATTVSISPSDLGTKQIGQIFTIDVTGGVKGTAITLFGHDSSGRRIEKSLAYWPVLSGDVGMDIHNIYAYFPYAQPCADNTGENAGEEDEGGEELDNSPPPTCTNVDTAATVIAVDLFLTKEGEDVSEIAAYQGNNHVDEASIVVRTSPSKAGTLNGTVTFTYTAAEWARRNEGLEAMLVDAGGEVVAGGKYRVVNHETIRSGGSNSYRVQLRDTTSQQLLSCVSRHKAFIRFPRGKMVAQINCP